MQSKTISQIERYVDDYMEENDTPTPYDTTGEEKIYLHGYNDAVELMAMAFKKLEEEE